jgi:5-methylcytosine-specific restriction endonuclease McrA
VSEEYKRNSNTACSVCGIAIYRRPAVLKQNSGRAFCNQTCYGLAMRKEHPCTVCGKPILASANKKTCSRSCANTQRAGIKYDGPRKDKVHFQRGLKMRLLKKRGPVCERCGYAKYEILNVHHKDRNREHNELDNLELLCPNCHAEEHYLENNWFSGKVLH